MEFILEWYNQALPARRTQILAMRCEGSSGRSIHRVADVSINTVAKLREQAGEAYLARHDEVSNVKANLTIRMSMRRFTRLINAFSTKFDNHVHALSLYLVFYNFCRIDMTLRLSPTMAAGVNDRLWSLEDVLARFDVDARAPVKRGPYKKPEKAASRTE